MAFTFTNKTSGTQTSASSKTIASVTYTSGKMYFLWVGAGRSGGTPNDPTVSGWTEVKTQAQASGPSRTTLFRFAGDGSTAAAVIDFAGQTQDVIQWNMDEVDGCKVTGTNGADSVVQSVSGTNGSGSPSATLAAFASASNAAYAGTYHQFNATATAESGFTLTKTLTGFYGLHCEYQTSNADLTPAFTVGNTSQVWTEVAIEVALAASGTPDDVAAPKGMLRGINRGKAQVL